MLRQKPRATAQGGVNGGSAVGDAAGTEDSDNAVSVTGGRVSVQSGDWNIVITVAGVEIADYSCSDTDVTVLDTIEGYTVIAIGDNAFSGSSISSVTIPDSVTSIGDGAFSGCTWLVEVVVEGTLTDIGDGAFDDCTSLTDVPTVSGGTDPIKEHTYSYSTAYGYDEASHWHERSCGAKSGTAAHVKDDDVTSEDKITYTCTVCGYTWTETISPTGTYSPPVRPERLAAAAAVRPTS